MSRLGTRGGTIHSLEEADAVQAAYKREIRELVRSSILDVLARQGTYTAADLLPYDLPEAAENVIGAVTRNIAHEGLMRKTGYVASTNPARHGGANGIYEITETGRRAIAGDGGTGEKPDLIVGGSCEPAAAVSGDAKAPERKVKAGSAGVELDLPPAEPLPLFDVAQAPAEPAWMDPDQRSAA